LNKKKAFFSISQNFEHFKLKKKTTDHLLKVDPRPELERPGYILLSDKELEEKDDPEAWYQSCIREYHKKYYRGTPRKACIEEVEHLLYKSAESGHPVSLGVALHRRGYYKQALKILIDSSNRGHPLGRSLSCIN
jgi:hypothetical protein